MKIINKKGVYSEKKKVNRKTNHSLNYKNTENSGQKLFLLEFSDPHEISLLIMSTRSLVTLVEWRVATAESFVSLTAPTGGVNEQKMASLHCFTQNGEILR